MRVVFMGTPDFAVEILKGLISEHEVVAVISQPDRAKDRKGRLLATPVKQFAVDNGVPVFQYEKVKEHVSELKALNADIFVTAAYGQILSQEIIDIPRFGIVNVHASLLPRYRGSSPMQAAILSGDEITGVTIMQTAIGMDTGDILLSKPVEIGDMNMGELSEALSKTGSSLLLEALPLIESGKIERKKQDDSLAVNCRKISKDAAEIRFDNTAGKIYNLIRAFNPSPVAFTFYQGERLKVYAAEVVDGHDTAGKILAADRKNGLVVACKEGALRLRQVQAPGKRIMSDVELINGKKFTVGDYFGK